MGNVKKDKPEGYFYLRSTGDGKGIIHLQYFVDGKTVRIDYFEIIEPKGILDIQKLDRKSIIHR